MESDLKVVVNVVGERKSDPSSRIERRKVRRRESEDWGDESVCVSLGIEEWGGRSDSSSGTVRTRLPRGLADILVRLLPRLKEDVGLY